MAKKKTRTLVLRNRPEEKPTEPAHRWQVEWVPIDSIKLDPDNRNKHPQDQIERLAKGMTHYGWIGNPVVANPSRVCKAGEGRLLAARKAGLKEVPVHFKEFTSEDDERGWAIFDNGIAKWADLDLSAINAMDIPEFGPDFDIDLLGLKDFTLDPNFEPGSEDDQGQLDEKELVFMECPHCHQKFEKGQARVVET